jgi:uncharacterized membrane protein
MKKIVLVWNIVFYFAYRVDYLVLKCIDFQKEVFGTAFKNSKFETGAPRASSFMFVLSFFMGFSTFLICESLHRSDLPESLIVILGIPYFVFTFFTLLYKDRYLAYFKVFHRKPKAWKIKWALISLGIVLLILVLLVFAFRFETYSFARLNGRSI